MDTNTKKRFLSQMLANLEQVEQSCNELGLVTKGLNQYKIYIHQQLKEIYEQVPDKEK